MATLSGGKRAHGAHEEGEFSPILHSYPRKNGGFSTVIHAHAPTSMSSLGGMSLVLGGTGDHDAQLSGHAPMWISFPQMDDR